MAVKVHRSTSPSLIGIGSGARPDAFRAAHVSTQWAVVGLVRSLARELRPDGIRVNAILPETLDGTPVLSPAVAVDDGAMNESDPRHITTRRRVTADDVAGLALFLCSPAARNLTGQAIGVDGSAECL